MLAAVRELLEEDGYQAATIPAVARRAPVTTTTWSSNRPTTDS